MKWYLKCLRQYADFGGRAQRKEYWMFTLFNVIFILCVNTLDVVIPETWSIVIGGIYAMAILLPGLAVSIRRLHDTGRSGWWILLILIPVVGMIVIFIFMLLKGDSGKNDYGPDPLDEDDATSEEYQLDDSCALIHVYRPSSMKGAAISYNLHLDDKIVFRVRNKSYTTVRVTDGGLKTLWAKTESREKLPINIELGKEYYIRCGLRIGVIVGRPQIKIIDNFTGKFEFDKIKNRKR